MPNNYDDARRERDYQRFRDERNNQGDVNHDMGNGTTTANQPAAAPTLVPRSIGGANSRGAGAQGETPVDPFTNVNARAFPNTTNALLPYYTSGSLSLAAGATDETAVKTFTIRMNSIYDCMAALTHSEDPTITADTADGTVNTPIMRKWWTSFYRYWHVVGADIKVRFWSETLKDGEVDIFSYFHGLQNPPIVNDTGTTGGIVHKEYRILHPHMYYQTFICRPSTATDRNLYSSGVTFTILYQWFIISCCWRYR